MPELTVAPVADQWGVLCGDEELANYWADQLLPLLRDSWAKGPAGGWVKGGSLCLSCLVAAGRYEELRDLLALRSFRFWPDDKFWALALVKKGTIDEAIEFAESCSKDSPGYDYGGIVEFCEQTLLESGREDEAYERYAGCALRATTNLDAFRRLVKKYPHRDPHKILSDLIARSGQKGKWFASAKEAGCLDVALECAADPSAEPATLLRAARDFIVKDTFFASNVALCALRNLLAGGGYEPTTFDVGQAYQYLLEAAGKCGRTTWAEAELDRLIERGASPGRELFLNCLMARRVRQRDLGD